MVQWSRLLFYNYFLSVSLSCFSLNIALSLNYLPLLWRQCTKPNHNTNVDHFFLYTRQKASSINHPKIRQCYGQGHATREQAKEASNLPLGVTNPPPSSPHWIIYAKAEAEEKKAAQFSVIPIKGDKQPTNDNHIGTNRDADPRDII